MFRIIKNWFHWLQAIFWVLWYRIPSRQITVIGVTGTDGKTTTTTLIYHILKNCGYRASMISTVHANIGGQIYDTGFHVTSLSSKDTQRLLRRAVDNGDTHMVLEITSHGIDQHRIFGVFFYIGLITNITHEHLDYHKTFDSYFKTKMKLLKQSKIVLINRDEKQMYDQTKKILYNKKIVTYGTNANSDISLEKYPLKSPLPGNYNILNCLAAIAVATTLNIDKHKAISSLQNFPGIPGRMEVMQNRPFRIIVDFAHTPNAIEKVLSTVRKMTKGKIIHVFGSAGLRDFTKRPLMGLASSRYSDILVLTEEDYRTEKLEKIMDQIESGIDRKRKRLIIQRIPQRSKAIDWALRNAHHDDTVIITGKGHEKSLCRGKVEYPWNDIDYVNSIIVNK